MAVNIDPERCCGCSYCLLVCPKGAVESYGFARVTGACTDCGLCISACPTGAMAA